MKSRDELEAEYAELAAKNEAATSWGAAVGARHERMKEIERTLRYPPKAPSHEAGTQEPVAWQKRNAGNDWAAILDCSDENLYALDKAGWETRPLYAAPQPASVAQEVPDSLGKLSDMVTAKIEQLEHYREYNCQLDHAKTIADGRISQAIQILHWIAQLSSVSSTEPSPPPTDGEASRDRFNDPYVVPASASHGPR